jgi:hypothetical protein
VLAAPSIPLPDLLDRLELPVVRGVDLKAHEAALRAFDETLDELRTYISLFCSCGTPLDAGELRELVSRLTRQYDALSLADARGAFEGVPVREHLPWLHSLRGSELFLGCWRLGGRRAHYEVTVVRGASEMEREFAQLAEMLWSEDDPEFTASLRHFGAADVSDDLSLSAAINGTAMEEEGGGGVSSVTIAQADVLLLVIPAARALWSDLEATIRDGSILVTTLQHALGRISEAQVEEELALLASTCQGRPAARQPQPSPSRHPWVPVAVKQLRDFLQLVALRTRLPHALAVWGTLGRLCVATVESDELGKLLGQQTVELEKNWSGLRLSAVSSTLAPLLMSFSAFGPRQLALLTQLAGAPRLLEWLLEKAKSNDEFNR